MERQTAPSDKYGARRLTCPARRPTTLWCKREINNDRDTAPEIREYIALTRALQATFLSRAAEERGASEARSLTAG